MYVKYLAQFGHIATTIVTVIIEHDLIAANAPDVLYILLIPCPHSLLNPSYNKVRRTEE